MTARVLHFFPTPVIIDELEGAEDLNRELEPAIVDQRQRDSGLKLSNRGGWQSKRDFPQWGGDAGKRIIEHAVRLASENTGHAPNRSYVRAGEGEGGQLVLHDPRMPALRMHAPGLRFKDAGPDVRTTIEPKSGLMVLFPAWLLHSVEPWQGDGHRISVAMNIRASMARR